METLDRELVVITYLMRGIEDFFVAFSKFDESFSRYEPFFNSMGFEMVTKAYLLATRASEYEGLERREAVRKIDEIAKSMGHNVYQLTESIKEFIGEEKIQSILDQKYDGFTGSQFLDVLKAAYLESRYPVPDPIHEKFPADESGLRYWDPLNSSGLHKFCYAFCREVLRSLKSDFGITLTDSLLAERVYGEASVRFCNLFFGENKRDFVSA